MYKRQEQEGTRPLRLGTASGDEVRVEGKVDRVDCYHGSDRDYIRVIDYKTGGKKFDLSEVVQGLNMQTVSYTHLDVYKRQLFAWDIVL